MAGLIEPDQKGKREDLSDLIAVVDAKATPVQSMIPKGKDLTNTLFEWQADKFDDPQTGGVLDGQDADTFTNNAADRDLLYGRIQKVWRKPMVSDMAENVSDVAGVKSEMARAIAKDLKHLARDIEATICSDNDSQAQAGSNPYKTRGLGEWIKATAQTDLPVPEDYRTPSAAINTTAMASLSETNVNAVLEAIFQETGQNRSFTLVCGTALKTAFTGFSLYVPDKASHLAVRRMNQSKPQMIEHTVSVYEGDFGTLNLIVSLFLANGTSNAPTRRGYVLNSELLELRYKRRPRFTELENKGGGRRGIVDAIFGLCVKNPRGLGKFAATS